MCDFNLTVLSASCKAMAEPCDIARMIVYRCGGDLDPDTVTFLIEISCSRGRLSTADLVRLDRLAKQMEVIDVAS